MRFARLATLLVAALALLPGVARAQRAPAITAPAGIVMEARTGEVLWQKEAETERPIASTTKLMTALITLEDADLDQVVTAPRYRLTSTAESVVGLIPGERITVRDLLRALLVESANDAAYTLALKIGGTVPEFVDRMNARAAELGLEHTSYANPVGLDDPDNYSTALDLATLTLELRKSDLFREIVSSRELTIESGERPRTLSNTNTLLGAADFVDGVKTGYTSDAGEVLVASGKKAGIPMISVVLGAETDALRNQESVDLLDFGFSRFERSRAQAEGDIVRTLPIADRPGAELPVLAGRTVTRVVRKGSVFDKRVDLPEEIEGPIGYHEKLGEMVISVNGAAGRPSPADLGAQGPGRRNRPPDPEPPHETLDVARARRDPSDGHGDHPTALVAPAARASAPHDHHRHPQRRDRQDDGGAELPARPAPPDGGSDDGRRVARASTSRGSSRRSGSP